MKLNERILGNIALLVYVVCLPMSQKVTCLQFSPNVQLDMNMFVQKSDILFVTKV